MTTQNKAETTPEPKPAGPELHPAIEAARKAALERMEKDKSLPPIVPKAAPAFATKAAAKKAPEPEKAKAAPKAKKAPEPEPEATIAETIEDCVIPSREEVMTYVECARTFVAAAKEFLDASRLVAGKPWPSSSALDENVYETIDNIITEDGQGLVYAIEDAELIAKIHDPATTTALWVKELFAPKSKAKEAAAATAPSRPSVQRRPQPTLAIKQAKKGKVSGDTPVPAETSGDDDGDNPIEVSV
jgi:hypothetical protein